MADEKSVVAVDLGAESGRVLLFTYDGATFKTHALHRFPNTPRLHDGHLRWDWTHIQREIAHGLALAAEYHPLSVGVDAWGVDSGFIDRDGNLMFDPIHYRDVARNSQENIDHLTAKVPLTEIYRVTGIQNMSINTLYQLHWHAEHTPQVYAGSTLLYIPDLIHYWLTGVKVNEYTDATTSQAFDATTGNYATELLARLGIPAAIFPPVKPPGTNIGPITLNHPLRGIPVILPASHDTGSAVAGVPVSRKEYAYLSSGTWSLLGLEISAPIMSAQAQVANLTNEGGVAGTVRFLKNITGLWIMQESRRTWAAAGQSYDNAQLVEMAAGVPAFAAFFDPNAPEFLPPGDMPARIRAWCVRTGQPAPQSPATVARSIFESLALKYREVLDELKALSGQRVEVLHIIGGGVNNRLLCQMAADSLGIEVLAGPTEATALGNAMVQFVGLGIIPSIEAGRAVIRASVTTDRYLPDPQARSTWDAAYQRFSEMTAPD